MIYRQSTGELTEAGGQVLAVCYAGRGDGKNQPGWQSVANTGPLPRGVYHLGPLAVHGHLGPSIELVADQSNRMMGRSAFYAHLDNPQHIGDSSDGCIVCPSIDVLQAMIATGDTTLQVVE